MIESILLLRFFFIFCIMIGIPTYYTHTHTMDLFLKSLFTYIVYTYKYDDNGIMQYRSVYIHNNNNSNNDKLDV